MLKWIGVFIFYCTIGLITSFAFNVLVGGALDRIDKIFIILVSIFTGLINHHMNKQKKLGVDDNEKSL